MEITTIFVDSRLVYSLSMNMTAIRLRATKCFKHRRRNLGYVADAEIARLGTRTFQKKVFTYHKPEPLYKPEEGWGSRNEKITLSFWLSEEDIDYYASTFEKTGFTGPLNYYRCLDS